MRFNEEAFLHELHLSDLNLVCAMNDVNRAWSYFKKIFLAIVDNNAYI